MIGNRILRIYCLKGVWESMHEPSRGTPNAPKRRGITIQHKQNSAAKKHCPIKRCFARVVRDLFLELLGTEDDWKTRTASTFIGSSMWRPGHMLIVGIGADPVRKVSSKGAHLRVTAQALEEVNHGFDPCVRNEPRRLLGRRSLGHQPQRMVSVQMPPKKKQQEIWSLESQSLTFFR